MLERLRVGMLAPPWYEIPPEGYGGIEDMVGRSSTALRGWATE
jgi:hypothetical protein